MFAAVLLLALTFFVWRSGHRVIDAVKTDAHARLSEVELGIAEANHKAAEANVLAEQERLARLQLEARLADRTLSEEQRTSIADILRPLGSFSTHIFLYSDVTEVQRIGGNIASLLAAAGWTVGVATG